jgi:hypothetical protein
MEEELLRKKIDKVKAKLLNLGPMRPGKLSQQFKDPKTKQGGYWQLSYTYQMKSKTEYVRPEALKRIRQETATFKKFKALMDDWIDLELQQSRLLSEKEKLSG